MRYGSIYLIENKLNNKKYIGQTIFLVEERWKSHIKGSQIRVSAIQQAILKYGAESFNFIELCSCTNEKDLNYMEEYFIEYYQTYRKGYNKTLGGDASSGKFTQDVRLKMRLAKLNKKRGPYKVNQSGSLKGKEVKHAQRLEGEPTQVEYNPSTSSRQPNKYEQLKERIIEIYKNSNSSYAVAKELNLDKSHTVRYLKKWGEVNTQSVAASQRNKKRYELTSEFIKLVHNLRMNDKSISEISRLLKTNRKTVYRALILAEKIV